MYVKCLYRLIEGVFDNGSFTHSRSKIKMLLAAEQSTEIADKPENGGLDKPTRARTKY